MTLIKIDDALTGESIIREMNAAELAQVAQDIKDDAAAAKAQTAKLAARQAVLDKLGLTTDELNALLG